MEVILAFLGGFFLSWPSLLGLMILGIIAEYNEAQAWAIFFAMAAALVSYLFFGISLMSLVIYSMAYVVIGLIWSFWRYKRHADNVVKENKYSSEIQKKYVLSLLHPSRMVGTIVSWVIVWPFSIIENLTSDVITMIKSLVTNTFRAVYNSIYNSAASKLK